MKNNYTIEEILKAIEDLQKIKKNKSISFSTKRATNQNNLNIPMNTLKLIEEAEKSQN